MQPGYAPQQYPPLSPGYPLQQYVQQYPMGLKTKIALILAITLTVISVGCGIYVTATLSPELGAMILVFCTLTNVLGLGGVGCKKTGLMITHAVFAGIIVFQALIVGCFAAYAAWAVSLPAPSLYLLGSAKCDNELSKKSCTNTHLPSSPCSFDYSASMPMETEIRCTTPPPLPTLAPFSWVDAQKATEEAAAKARAEAEAREEEKRAARARKEAFLAKESEAPERCLSCPASPSPLDHPEQLDDRPGSALGLVTWIDLLREQKQEEKETIRRAEAKMAAQLMADSCYAPAHEPAEVMEMEVDREEDNNTAVNTVAPMQLQDVRRKKSAAQYAVQQTSSTKAVNEEELMKRTAADLEAAETLILLSRSPSPAADGTSSKAQPQISEHSPSSSPTVLGQHQKPSSSKTEKSPADLAKVDPIARVMMALGGSASLISDRSSLIEDRKKTPEELAIQAEIMKEINEALGEASDDEAAEAPKTSHKTITVEACPIVSESLVKSSKTAHDSVTIDPPSIETESLMDVVPNTQETSLEISMERKELEAYLTSSPSSKIVDAVPLFEATAVANVDQAKEKESKREEIQVLVDDNGLPIDGAAEDEKEEEAEQDRAEQENRFEKWLKLQEEHEGEEEQQAQDLREMALRLLALASLKEAVAERKKREAAAEADEEDEEIVVD